MNIGRLFLPGLVVSAENQGTFSDYHAYEFVNEPIGWFMFGGGWSVYSFAKDSPRTPSAGGLFREHEQSTRYGYFETIGSRLSKN